MELFRCLVLITILAGLPRHLNAQLENIHLMCASNRVFALEQVKPIVEELLLLQDGMVMFDTLWNQEVLVLAPVLACLCDNPRASEIVGHLRGNPNSFCRQCLVSRIRVNIMYAYNKLLLILV